jgi:biopolymer transport protein ExbD
MLVTGRGVGQQQALATDSFAPPLEIHAEARTRYMQMTDVLVAAQNAGVHNIGIAPVRD